MTLTLLLFRASNPLECFLHRILLPAVYLHCPACHIHIIKLWCGVERCAAQHEQPGRKSFHLTHPCVSPFSFCRVRTADAAQ